MCACDVCVCVSTCGVSVDLVYPLTLLQYVGWISPLDVIAMRLEGGLRGTHRGHTWPQDHSEDGARAEHVAAAAADFSHTDPFYMVPQDMKLSRVLAIIGGRQLVRASAPFKWFPFTVCLV